MPDAVDFDDSTRNDWELIKTQIGGRLFFYGPPLWRIGMTEHYNDAHDVADATIEEIVSKLSISKFAKGSRTLRIRKNIDPTRVLEESQYGVPPSKDQPEFGRFDSSGFQLLYTSPSLPVCLHECRVAITDDIFVATLEAADDLRLADLTGNYKHVPTTPFDNLRYFLMASF